MALTEARYEAIADFYEGFAPDEYDDPPTRALLDLIGDVSGLRILDLACGHGMFSRELARRGGDVTGVDLSSALIAKALASDEVGGQKIAYQSLDAGAPDALRGLEFDAVVCRFGLSDIDDLEAVLDTVTRVLRPGGFFAFSILHPCFAGWPSREARPSWDPRVGYYRDSFWRTDGPPHGLRLRVGANHRRLSTYFNALARRGLVLDRMDEPAPTEDWLDEPPLPGPGPVYLAAQFRRPTVQLGAAPDARGDSRG